MSLLRTILVWLSSVAVIFTGTTSHGYVLCRTADGAVNIETVGADGRCEHLAGSGSSEGLTTPVRLSPGVEDGCADQSLGGPARLTEASRPGAPLAIVVQAAPAFALRIQLASLLTPRGRVGPPAPGPEGTPTDSSFVRETVVLLV